MRLTTHFNIAPSRFSSNYARTNIGTASPTSRPKPKAIAQTSQASRQDAALVNLIAAAVAQAVTEYLQDPALTVGLAVLATQERADLAKLSARAEHNEQSGAITLLDNGGKFVAHMIRNGAGGWQMRARQ